MFDAENPRKNRTRGGSLLSMAAVEEAPRRPERERRPTRSEATSLLTMAGLGDDDAPARSSRERGRAPEERRARRPEPEAIAAPHPHASLKDRILARLFPVPSAVPVHRAERIEEPLYDRPTRLADEDEHEQRSPTHRDHRQSGTSGDNHWRPLIDPARVISGVVRARWLIVVMTILGAVLGVLVALGTPKLYYAATELLFDPRDLQIVERDLTRGGLPSDATLALIENQVSLITSGTVLTKVVDRLDLANNREFNGTGGGVLGLLTSPRALISHLFSGAGEEDIAVRHSIAVGNLADALDVSRNAKTFIITIGVTTRDAEKSAQIATMVTEVFLETYGDLQSATAGRANREINERLDSLRSEVQSAESAIADFKAKNDIVDAQGRLIADDEIVRLNDQLSAARARTAELKARAAAARSLDVTAVLGGALPEQVASPVMTELLAQYASLKQQTGRLAVRLGPRHPDRQSAEAELAGARDEIARELRRVVASNQVELQRAVQLEQDLAAQLARLKVEKGDRETERVTLRELEREAAAKRSVYEALLLRARETSQQEGLNTANVSIISEASAPLDPIGPSRAVIAITGMMLGFFAGVGLGAAGGALASLRESMADDRDNGRSVPPVDPTPPSGGRPRAAASSGYETSPSRHAFDRRMSDHAPWALADEDDDEPFEMPEEDAAYDPWPADEQPAPDRAPVWRAPQVQEAPPAPSPPVYAPQPHAVMPSHPQAVAPGWYGHPMFASQPMMPVQPVMQPMPPYWPQPVAIAHPAYPAHGMTPDEPTSRNGARADNPVGEIRDRLHAVRREIDDLVERRSQRRY